MVIDFKLTGSCPFWTLADPSAVAQLLLVDENYVVDNYSQYLNELKQEAFRGNALLVSSGVGRWIRIYFDEQPEVQSPSRPLLIGSYLQVPNGNIVCSMMHKLSTSRMDKSSQAACVPSGVYLLDAFSVTEQDPKNHPDVLVFLKPYGHELPKEFVAPYIPIADVEVRPQLVQRVWSSLFARPQ